MPVKNAFKTNIIKFLGIFLAYFFFYKLMLIKHFALDSYGYVKDPLGYNMGNIGVGRLATFGVTYIINSLGLNYVDDQKIFAVILMMSFAISAHLTAKLFARLSGKRYEYFIFPMILTFGNVLALEWFFFPEMMLAWACSILFSVLAALFVEEFYKPKYVVLSLLFIVISYCFYQGSIGFYIILSLIAVYYREKGELNARSFWSSALVLIIAFSGGAINLVITRIACRISDFAFSNRVGEYSVKGLIDNAVKVINVWWEWIYGMNGLLPGKLFFVFALILNVLALVFMCLRHKGGSGVIYYILLFVAANLSYLTPHFLTMELWMPQRTMVAMFALITVPVFVMLLDIDTGIFEWIGLILTVILIIVNVVKIDSISVNYIANNRMDEEIARMIQNRIYMYEAMTGNDIKVIYFHNDYDSKPAYDSVAYSIYDTNRKAFSVDWAASDCISYYSGRVYERRVMEQDIFDVIFGEGMNWNEFEPDEQLHFDGSVLYLAGY